VAAALAPRPLKSVSGDGEVKLTSRWLPYDKSTGVWMVIRKKMTSVDAHVGARIRDHRISLGLTSPTKNSVRWGGAGVLSCQAEIGKVARMPVDDVHAIVVRVVGCPLPKFDRVNHGCSYLFGEVSLSRYCRSVNARAASMVLSCRARRSPRANGRIKWPIGNKSPRYLR
jgi:hypothetical protein